MGRNIRLISWILIFLALLLIPDITIRFERKPDEAWARVRQNGVIRFAIDPTYMPFDGLGSQGDFFGLDVDMAREIARRIGVRAEFVATGYDSLYDALAEGQADATISALVVDPSRTDKWKYSTPYFEAGQVMIEPRKPPRSSRGATQGSEVDKTSEVSIAAEYGSEADAAARALARRQAGLEVKYFDTPESALRAVSSGAVDAAIIDGISADQWLPRFPDLQRGEQVTRDPYAIAVWGDSTQLLDAINAALADMQRDGTTQKTIAEWMKK